MVLDLNKVKLNESIEDGALSVVEQIPGFVTWADQTDKLRLGEPMMYYAHLKPDLPTPHLGIGMGFEKGDFF